MSPIVLSFADGTTFFVGLFIVLASGIFLLFQKGRIRSALAMFVVVGMVLVGASATPLPIWVYACWLVPVVAVLLLSVRVELTVILCL